MPRRRVIVANTRLAGLVDAFTQSVPFIVSPHATAALQFGHDEVDEVREARGRHHIN